MLDKPLNMEHEQNPSYCSDASEGHIRTTARTTDSVPKKSSFTIIGAENM
jgi:hypothetical protein